MNLKSISLTELQLDSEYEKVLIEYEEFDNLFIERKRIFKSKFFYLGLKEAQFNNVSINNSLFENCYLRYARFNNVNLTGTSFENCDLTNVKFNSCDIRYVVFRNCKLNINEVLGCLPRETNLKIHLLKELRLNQISVGDNKGADELLVRILDAEKELLMERVKCSTSYHQEREDLVSRAGALFDFFLLKLNDLIWGYGLKLSRLFWTALVTIVVFAALIFISTESEYIFSSIKGNVLVELSFWESVYVSYTNFSTVGYGSFTPNSSLSRTIFFIENTLGYIFLGFLVSGVYRRISK